MKPTLSLTTDPIPQLIWKISLPMSIGMFFNTMFNVVDTFCAGWLGTEAQAALSLSFPVFFILIALGSGISQGTTALLANAIGAGDKEDGRRVFTQAIFFILVASVVLTVAGLLVSPWLYRLLGAEGDYLKTSLAYMNVVLLGGVFVLLPMVFNSALSAHGNTVVYRNFLVAGFLANIVLNPVFILVVGMGVDGIALATVIVQIGGAFYLWTNVRKVEEFSGITLSELKPDRKILLRIAGQAIPAGLNMLTIAIGIFVVTWFVKHFGKEAVAAYGIATRIEQIVLMPTIGLNAAVMSIVGQNFGAKNLERVREAWLTNLKFGVLMMVVGGVLVWLTRGPMMRVFTRDEVVISLGSDYLLAAALTLAAYPLIFVTVFALQGIKKPVYGLWLGLYRQLVAPLLVIHGLVFTLSWGLWGVWWGICFVTWSAAAVIVVVGWRKIGRQTAD